MPIYYYQYRNASLCILLTFIKQQVPFPYGIYKLVHVVEMSTLMNSIHTVNWKILTVFIIEKELFK